MKVSIIFSHYLHLQRKLLFLIPIKLHPDLLFSPFMHALHSSLLISDNLSTRLDNEVAINLKLSINFSLCVIVLPLSSFFNPYQKSNIFFHIFCYAFKFAAKFFC